MVHDVFATHLTHAASVRATTPYLVGAICNASRQYLRRAHVETTLFCGEEPCAARPGDALMEEVHRKIILSRDQLQNGFIIGAATLSYLCVQPLAGRLADRMNPIKVIFGGLVLSAAGVVLIPFTAGGLLIAVAVLGGLGVGTVWTNTDAMVSKLADQGRIAAALGAAGSFKELGDMLGPLLIGALAQALRLRVAFVICGALGSSP